MRKFWAAGAAVIACAGLTVSAGAFARGQAAKKDGQGRAHNHLSRAEKAQHRLRDIALQDKVKGNASGKVKEVAKGQFVELEQTGQDEIFALLAEFGTDTIPLTGGAPGPLHNQIEQPDRKTDNTTIWQADYNAAHYQDMYFNRMNAFYKAQSSGRYGVTGHVEDWVKVPYNEAYYGSNKRSDAYAWLFIRDALKDWYSKQLAAGKTEAQIDAYVSQFDKWDRYDYDHDGNFDEADGYIDHFQIVHAGADEATGGGAQGEDALWSHRWYAFESFGSSGPGENKHGGLQIGNTKIWVGDYTLQPENGGLGVFAHEFGHDLGLPDHYDQTYLGENSSSFWNLMSAGSYMGDGSDAGIGTTPIHMSAWDKFVLGWLNYDVAEAGKRSSHKLGPAEANTKQSQGLFVVLPEQPHYMKTPTPQDGTHTFWSGSGALMDNAMSRQVAVPAGASAVAMRLWYDIEVDYDYGYVSASTDGGKTWTNLASSFTTNDDPNDQNQGNGFTGNSGGWIDASFDISAFAGKTVTLAIRYWTDPYTNGRGIFADSIKLGDLTSGAEGADNDGWTLNGFSIVTENVFLGKSPAYYLAEYRQYRDYDSGLRTGPYNWVNSATPDLAEHFPYQDGLLVALWDPFWGEDNQVGLHPGEGFYLPIDARPTPLLAPNGAAWRTRIQVYDATFGLEPTDAFTLHQEGVAQQFPSRPAVPVFDDTKDFWFASKPDAGVKVPPTGTAIEVVGQSAQGAFMQVQVRPSN